MHFERRVSVFLRRVRMPPSESGSARSRTRSFLGDGRRDGSPGLGDRRPDSRVHGGFRPESRIGGSPGFIKSAKEARKDDEHD